MLYFGTVAELVDGGHHKVFGGFVRNGSCRRLAGLASAPPKRWFKDVAARLRSLGAADVVMPAYLCGSLS